MDMEVVVIDCVTVKDLSRTLRESTDVVIYCIKRDALPPPDDSMPLDHYDFHKLSVLQKFHLILQSELEFGYRLCQLSYFHPTIYTSRADTSPFRILGLQFVTTESSPVKAREVRGGDEDVSTVLLVQLEEKVRSMILTNPELITAVKPASALAQIRNLANGILISYQSRKKSPGQVLPQPHEMAEFVHSKLCKEGILSVQSTGKAQGPVRVEAEGPKQGLTSPVVLMIKRDGLNNYITGILQNPIGRAAKEKAARSQLLNYISQQVQNYRRKQALSLPPPEELAFPMFNHLKFIGVLTSNGLTVSYNEGKIAELAESPSMKEMVVQAEDGEVAEGPASEVGLGLLNAVATSYYRNNLLSDVCKGKTERAIKEQIRLLASQSLRQALRDNPRAPVPNEESLTSAIYQALIREQAIVLSGSEVRYVPENIENLGRKLERLSLFSEKDVRTEGWEAGVRELREGVLAEMKVRGEMRLGEVQKMCLRKALGYLTLDSRSYSHSAPELSVHLLHSIFSTSPYALPLPPGVTLETVLQNLDSYSYLQVREVQEQGDEGDMEDA